MRSCRPLVLFKLSFVKVFIAIISLKPLTGCVMSHDFILFVIVFQMGENVLPNQLALDIYQKDQREKRARRGGRWPGGT